MRPTDAKRFARMFVVATNGGKIKAALARNSANADSVAKIEALATHVESEAADFADAGSTPAASTTT